MIRAFLSRYHFRYSRSLAYMLQASEYNPNEYLSWYRRVTDFSDVEKRKQLVKTKKALLLLIIIWTGLLLLYVLAFTLLIWTDYPLNVIGFTLVVAAAPLLIGYGIIIPLFVIRVSCQKPAEFFIKKRAQKQIQNHLGIKIGIAGSYGKTSMREILKTVLSEGKAVSAPPGSYNTVLGISSFIKTLSGKEEVLLFELGEYYPGDVRELCELVKPEIGVITGVNEAHLEKFGSLDKTAETIFELADWIGDKPLYVNGENALAKKHAASSHFLYSREGLKLNQASVSVLNPLNPPSSFAKASNDKCQGDVTGKFEEMKVSNPVTDLSGTRFELDIQENRTSFVSGLLGLHQIGPLAAAIALALRLGIPLDSIRRGVAKTKPFEHRLQPRTDPGGVVTLDDSYNGNPDGVKVAIDFLSGLTNRRRFYVTPGLVEMGAKTEFVHREIGKCLSKAGIEKVLLVKNSITGFIAEGLEESNFSGELLWYDDALAAFAALPYLTVSGDVVLLQNDLPDQYY